MHSDHRAQLAAAVTRFLDDIRRLGQTMIDRERDRLLGAMAPSRTRGSAVTGAAAATAQPSRARSTGATSAELPARGRPAATATPARSAATATPARPAATGRSRALAVAPAHGARRPDAAVKATQAATRPAATQQAATRPAATPAAATRPAATRAAPTRAATDVVAAAEALRGARAPVARRTRASAAAEEAAPATRASTKPASTPAATAPSTELGAIAPAVAAPAAEVGHRPEPSPGAPDGARCRGTVKWFSDDKGYGFIRGDDGRDAFVHYSAISNAGFRTLIQGQAVEYELQQSPKGLQAVSVTSPQPVAPGSR